MEAGERQINTAKEVPKRWNNSVFYMKIFSIRCNYEIFIPLLWQMILLYILHKKCLNHESSAT